MLRRDRKHIRDSQPMNIIGQARLPIGVNLVDRQKQRLSSLSQQPRQLEVGRRKLRTPIHNHHDGESLIEREPGLPKNLSRDEICVLRNDATRIHDAKLSPTPLRVPIEPVASNARLIAHNGPPRADDAIEQGRFTNIRPAHDRKNRQGRRAMQKMSQDSPIRTTHAGAVANHRTASSSATAGANRPCAARSVLQA